MLQSHFVLLVIFSLCVSIVFAALMREEMREQITQPNTSREPKGEKRARFPFWVAIVERLPFYVDLVTQRLQCLFGEAFSFQQNKRSVFLEPDPDHAGFGAGLR